MNTNTKLDVDEVEGQIKNMLKPDYQPATPPRPTVSVVGVKAPEPPPELPQEPRTVTEWLRYLDAKLDQCYARLETLEASLQARLDEVLGTLK